MSSHWFSDEEYGRCEDAKSLLDMIKPAMDQSDSKLNIEEQFRPYGENELERICGLRKM